jgi:DNA-binding MarR family transcriptional regulator
MAATKTLERDHVDSFLEKIEHELSPELDMATEGIVERIGGLSRRFHRFLDETVAAAELTSGEWKTLGHLTHAGPPYRRSPGQLAERADLSSGAMTNRLDRLEAAGLIRRLPDPDDRRGTQVELTPAGRKAYKRCVAEQAAKEGSIVGVLNDREKEQLNGMLRRLMIAAEQHDRGRRN